LRQQEVIQIWKQSANKQCNGTIVAVTGFGKSRTVIEYAMKPIQEKINLDDYEVAFIVIVDSTNLRKQWIENPTNNNIQKFQVYTINSFIKIKNIKCKLIVYDEVDRYGGSKFRKCFYNVDSDWKLGLTGTITKEFRIFLNLVGIPVVAEVTRKEAEINNWVATVREYNLPVYLNEKESVIIKLLQEEYDKKLSFLSTDSPEWSIVEKILDKKIIGVRKDSEGNDLYYTTGYKKGQKKYIYEYKYAEKIAKIKDQELGIIIRTAIRLRQIIQERKKIIYNHPAKIQTLKKLLELFENRKVVTFSMENSFVDEIVKVCGGVALHTSVGNKNLRKQILDDFINDKFNIIHTCSMINRGTDIKGLEIGINISYYSKASSNLQKIGRIIRKEGEKEPIFVNLYLKNHPKIREYTQEELWLRRQQKDRSDQIEWLTSIYDLKDIVNGNTEQL
jgi:superfamily II DNA or RNA helicase